MHRQVTLLKAFRPSLIIMICLSAAVAVVSLRFVPLGLEDAFGGIGAFRADQKALLTIHVIAGPLALVSGAIQFVPALRMQRPSLHRWIGRVYVAAVVIGGLSGLVIAPSVPGCWLSGMGFGALAILWLGSTVIAFVHARARRITAHRRWMIRSFSLSFAAVTLRIYLPMFFVGGMDYDAAAPWLAWICWVPNLVIAERWLIKPGRAA